MTHFLKLYGIALSIFLAIDMLWLTVIAKKLYSQHLGYLMAKSPNLVAAGIFYLLFIAGLVVFVLTPTVESRSAVNALVLGAFFGLVTYATYDLTNLATIRDWPLTITIIDLIWGATLSGLVAFLSYHTAIKFGL